MKYIVLLSNGYFDHSFKLFATLDEAQEYAKRQTRYSEVHVNELVKDEQF